GMNRLRVNQAIIWTVGTANMSGATHIIGLCRATRRSAFTQYRGTEQASHWIRYQMPQEIGVSILFIGILLMVYIFIKLAFIAPIGETEFPIAQEEPDAQPTPKFLENWKLWIILTIALILFAYTIPFIDIIHNSPPGSVPFDWPIGR